MKNLIALAACVLGLTTTMSAHAQNVPLQKVSREDLYRHFFSINSDDQCKERTNCRMLRRHLIRDTKNCEMDPTDVEVVSNYVEANRSNPETIKGAIKYLGVAPGKYEYDTFIDERGRLNIETSIYFKNLDKFSASEISRLESRMKTAANKWTQGNRFSANPVIFHLKLARKRSEGKIKAKLKKNYTRGPYFSRWSMRWGSSTIAHEMGHMLGLDDEYSNNPFGGSLANCNTSSIMCNPGASPKDYQYYLIFRRMLCN